MCLVFICKLYFDKVREKTESHVYSEQKNCLNLLENQSVHTKLYCGYYF